MSDSSSYIFNPFTEYQAPKLAMTAIDINDAISNAVLVLNLSVSYTTQLRVSPHFSPHIVQDESYIAPKIIGDGKIANAESTDTVKVILALLSILRIARMLINVLGKRPVADALPNITPTNTRSVNCC